MLVTLLCTWGLLTILLVCVNWTAGALGSKEFSFRFALCCWVLSDGPVCVLWLLMLPTYNWVLSLVIIKAWNAGVWFGNILVGRLNRRFRCISIWLSDPVLCMLLISESREAPFWRRPRFHCIVSGCLIYCMKVLLDVTCIADLFYPSSPSVSIRTGQREYVTAQRLPLHRSE